MNKYSFSLLVLLHFSCNDQQPDTAFNTQVPSPYVKDKVVSILYDEGHNNIHRLNKTYRTFRDILKNDGYAISTNSSILSQSSFNSIKILVIVNAMGGKITDKYRSAFDDAECRAIEQWVHEGGSLLLVTDHYPVGSATKTLADKFGIGMGEGTVEDSISSHYDMESGWKDQLIFSKENGYSLTMK
jgi:hypothetical protein